MKVVSQGQQETALLMALLGNIGIIVGLLVVIGVGYMVLILFIAGRRIPPHVRAALVIAIAAGVVGYILILGGYLITFSPLRHDPPGLANPYRALDTWQAYRVMAQSALVLLHSGLIFVSGALGYLIGRRLGGRAWMIAAGSLIGVVGFVVLTLPVTEFARICLTDVALILEPRC